MLSLAQALVVAVPGRLLGLLLEHLAVHGVFMRAVDAVAAEEKSELDPKRESLFRSDLFLPSEKNLVKLLLD